jgi:hypothetical protein
MSVGDKKGGLEWMYQRWPPGKDVDAHGRLLRIASEDTYQSGMGWLSHNVFETKSNIVFDKEEELLTEAWGDWGINLASWGADEYGDVPASPGNTTPSRRMEDLDSLVAFSDALSASDIYSRVGLPSYDNICNQPVDPSLPPMSAKERLSYTIDAPLLQVDEQTDFLGLDTSLATQTHILLHRAFPSFSHQPPSSISSNSTSSEQHYANLILHHKAITHRSQPLTRSTFSSALDILATPPSQDLYYDQRTTYTLTPSSFDRHFSLITLDLAPYIRSIVAYEQVLEAQRIRLGNLLSEGGGAKRQRTTRASRTAMEGGERKTKRRERWFSRTLNFELVMQTAGEDWAGLGWKGEEEGSVGGSLTGTMQSESLVGTQRSADDIPEAREDED